MNLRKTNSTQVKAAAKAGFSERSARNIEKRGYRATQPKPRKSSRKDPFDEVWKLELIPMLEMEPLLQAKTLLEHLQQKHEGKYPDKLLRTLQRRVKQWRLFHGPSKEVIFRQNHPPGWQGLSDFTDANKLGITIQSEPFPHLLYHYRLAFSGWEYAEIVEGGESYTALTEGLQNALWQCGGVPQTHRTDSLSAAFKNLSQATQEDLTHGYQAFCVHYCMEATRNNRGVSHENGSVESSHRHLKSRIDQALMVRGSREFKSREAYGDFLRKVMAAHNRRVGNEHMEELSHLQKLPERKTTDYTEERVTVTSSSTFSLRGVIYSVPSRLIAEILKIHLYDSRLECYAGGDHVITLRRKHRNKQREREIDYRHVIEALVRKPGAFNNYIYKEAFFPTLAFRQAWERLNQEYDNNKACKEYLLILREAAKENNEEKVSEFLERRLLKKKTFSAQEIQELFTPQSQELPQQIVTCGSLKEYSTLGGRR